MTYLFNFNNLVFSLDYVSLFFISVILLVSVPSAVFSIGYLKKEYSNAKITTGWILLTIFVLSMMAVVTVRDAFLFIIVWEIMSLVSYFLVVFDTKDEKSIQAGTIYIVMTHIGTAFIILAVLTMYKYAGSFDFAVLKEACYSMPSEIKNRVFLFLLIGFGTKAGIVPLHIWLPYAHPQAPSHISGIMSGVMIKTGIYGIIRFVIYILGVDSLWWGILILIVAAISCLVGVIYALMEHDIKKLLAYCSVENIGIILLGVGTAMIFIKINSPIPAVFAMTAGLYHLINHALFKGLLFLCAGSIYKASGERDIEKLGGLIKFMPWTAASFLIGSMAISALPPLNGFVSEWLTFQVFFLGTLNTHLYIKVFMTLLAAVLALTGGLAAACFVKAFGITFLAIPRSAKAWQAKEVSFTMKAAMLFLAILTVIFGVAAPVIIKLLVPVAGSILDTQVNNIVFAVNNFTLKLFSGTEVYLSPFFISVALIGVLAITALTIYLLFGRAKVKRSKTWDCGYYALDSRTEYTATAFSKPFRVAFDFFLLPYRKTEKVRESFYYIKSFKYEVHTTPIFNKYIYEPFLKILFGAANHLKKMQLGSIHLYLAYIFITVVLLIIFMDRF
ncbi:MAG: proton-conducting transporter membrane subunit [Candidatus Omnitrophota bacterium]